MDSILQLETSLEKAGKVHKGCNEFYSAFIDVLTVNISNYNAKINETNPSKFYARNCDFNQYNLIEIKSLVLLVRTNGFTSLPHAFYRIKYTL